MIHLSKLWWGFIIVIVLVGGGIALFFWDGYTIRLWWRRTANPALEYKNYNTVNSDERISDEEITQSAKAQKLVEQLPEVAEWLKRFSGPKGTSKSGSVGWVQTESRLGDVYSIRAYEELGLGIPLVISTFGWYEVDRKTWEVKRVK